jgi:hypothetical protein
MRPMQRCVRKTWAFVFLISVILMLTSCQSSTEVTPTISWTPIPDLIATSASVDEAGQGRSPTPSICLNNAFFLEDLSIPDGTVVTPGDSIDKRWSVLNSGTCDWGPGYQLVRVGDDQLDGKDELALYPARAGATAVWQVILNAPLEPGDYLSRWQARTPEGSLFGDEVFLFVSVREPTPTPRPEPSPTP